MYMQEGEEGTYCIVGLEKIRNTGKGRKRKKC